MRTLLTLGGVAVAVAGLTVAVPASGQATAAVCLGKPATIEQAEGTVQGTAGDDVIVGGARTNVLAGAGNDTVCTIGGDVDGGPGEDSIEMRLAAGNDWGATLTDLEHFDVAFLDTLAHASLRLTKTPEVLTGSVSRPEPAGTHDGSVIAKAKQVTVDLQRGLVKLGPRLVLTIDGFKDASAVGRRVRVRGDDQRNYFHVAGCDVVATGGDDNDHMWIESNKVAGNCAPARLLGQRGNDRLSGNDGNDVLIGGPGRGDTAWGYDGKDVCIAEHEHGCER
jgi:hypothetical protein